MSSVFSFPVCIFDFGFHDVGIFRFVLNYVMVFRLDPPTLEPAWHGWLDKSRCILHHHSSKNTRNIYGRNVELFGDWCKRTYYSRLELLLLPSWQQGGVGEAKDVCNTQFLGRAWLQWTVADQN